MSESLPSAPAQMATSKKPSKKLKACLKLITGNSDEEVFAGLLMLTKHVSQEEFQSNLKLIFDSMNGTQFLQRLLDTVDKTSTGPNADIYLSLALTLSVTFCADKQCATSFKTLFESFQRLVTKTDIPMEVKDNAIECLLRIIEANPELKNSSLECCNIRNVHPDAEVTLSSERLIRLIEIIQLKDDDLLFLSNVYSTTRAAIGLTAGKMLLNYFQNQIASSDFYYYKRKETVKNKIGENLSTGVLAVLGSGNTTPEDHMKCALQLAQQLCRHVGPAWIYLPNQAGTEVTELRECGDKKAALLIGLISVELSVQMTKLRGVIVDLDASKTTNKDSPTQIFDSLDIIIACLSLLEYTIQFLVGMDEQIESKLDASFRWSEIGTDCLIKIRNGLIESFVVIVDFITICIENLPGSTTEDTEMKLLVQACAKCLSFWLQEESDEQLDVRLNALELIPKAIAKFPQVIPEFVPIFTQLSEFNNPIASLNCSDFCIHEAILFASRIGNSSEKKFDLSYHSILDTTLFLLDISVDASPVDKSLLEQVEGALISLVDKETIPVEELEVAGCLVINVVLRLSSDEYPAWLEKMGNLILTKIKEAIHHSFLNSNENFSRYDYLQNVVRPTIIMKLK